MNNIFVTVVKNHSWNSSFSFNFTKVTDYNGFVNAFVLPTTHWHNVMWSEYASKCRKTIMSKCVLIAALLLREVVFGVGLKSSAARLVLEMWGLIDSYRSAPSNICSVFARQNSLKLKLIEQMRTMRDEVLTWWCELQLLATSEERNCLIINRMFTFCKWSEETCWV